MSSDSKLGNRVYTEKDQADGRVHSKIMGNASSAVLAATAEYQVIVDADGCFWAEMHGNNPAGGDTKLRMAENGSITIDGVYHAANNSDPGNTGLVGMDRNDTPVDSHQIHRITAKQSADGAVRCIDISLHDEAGEVFSKDNPLPVSIEESEGGEIHDPNTADDVAKDAVSNHDYIVLAGKTLMLKKVIVDASGDGQWDLQIGDGATPTEGFIRLMRTWSSASKRGDMDWSLAPFKITAVADPRTLRLIKKNIDNSIQDLESLFVGVEF